MQEKLTSFERSAAGRTPSSEADGWFFRLEPLDLTRANRPTVNKQMLISARPTFKSGFAGGICGSCSRTPSSWTENQASTVKHYGSSSINKVFLQDQCLLRAARQAHGIPQIDLCDVLIAQLLCVPKKSGRVSAVTSALNSKRNAQVRCQKPTASQVSGNTSTSPSLQSFPRKLHQTCLQPGACS